jgi:glycosyltransferase involved in cell wall biosynthesis
MARVSPPDSAQSLRVLAVTPTGVMSGAERVLIAHALRGRVSGDEWTIAVPDGPAADRVDAEGIRRVRIGELKLGKGPRAIAAPVWALNQLRTRWALRTEMQQADVIVANSVLVLPLMRIVSPRPPVVWLVHDVITRPDLARVASLGSAVVRRALPVSEAAGDLPRRLGIPCLVVRNGIDVPDRPVSNQPVDPPIVGCTAVLTEWKGQYVLLEAAARVDGCVIELLGGALPKDGGYEARLRERAAQPDLAGRVRFLGHREDVNDVVRRWSIAVSPSIEPEAGPLAVLEAMAAGVPVVATDHGGAPEVLAGVGSLVAPGDPVALAEAIERLLEDPDEGSRSAVLAQDRVRTSLGRAGQERVFRQALHDIARSAPPP